MRDHRQIDGGIGGVAMVGIGTVIPRAIDRDRAGGTLTGREVGQEHFEHVGALEEPSAVVRGLHQQAALLRVGRDEMRIEPGAGKPVEPAHRHAPGRGRIGIP